MIEKVRKYIEQYEMLSPNDTVVAGISGGADSLCLLFLLCEFAQEIPLNIAVVHVNHKLREDAPSDAAYVEKICGELGVPFFLKEFDVERLSKRQGISTEEAGRNVRYQVFYEVLEQCLSAEGGQMRETKAGGRGRIAVAHTANDRAETMLFHLFRGTGLTGLSGIKPVRGEIIRPLLCLERPEIEAYLEEKGIGFCIDHTNYEDTYTRNKIRRHILAYAEENICVKSVGHMNRTAEMLAETEEFLQEQTRQTYFRIAKKRERGNEIAVGGFKELHVLLQKRVLLLCLEEIRAGRKDIGAVHIEAVRELFYKEGNKEISLPDGICARREFDRVFIGPETPPVIKPQIESINPVRIPGEIKIEGMGVFEFTCLEYDKSKIIPEKTYTKWFDYDKIIKSLVLRTRQTGDYLTINEALSTKPLKKYLIQEKVPRQERDKTYVLADGNHILWVVGYRISQYYKVGPKTKKILQVRLRGGQ